MFVMRGLLFSSSSLTIFPTVVVPGHRPDPRQDGGCRRGGEDTPSHPASQHAGPDVSSTEGLVAGPPSGDDAHLPSLYLVTDHKCCCLFIMSELTFSLTTTRWPSSNLRPGLIMVRPSRASSTTVVGLLINFFPDILYQCGGVM